MCSACDVRLSYSITQLSLSPCCIFFFNDSTTTELYTLSLHDALPISEADAVDADLPGIDLSPLHQVVQRRARRVLEVDRKSTRLNSSHITISYAVFCLKKKKNKLNQCTL